MPSLTVTDRISVLSLGAEENRFTASWLDEIEALLDDVVAAPEPTALVTVGAGKFYSNGLDLEWMTAHPAEIGEYSVRAQRLLARVLTLPVPTVAAVNGHAFGAGAMLAMAHDFRVMRTDRGYFCLPEVDIRIPFTPGMASLLSSKLTPQAAMASMTTGRRFGGEEARELAIVDRTASEGDLLTAAGGLVADLAGKDGATLAAIKESLFGPTAQLLRSGGLG